jgi:hypothetical protein
MLVLSRDRGVAGGGTGALSEDSSPVPPQFLGQARLARQHYHGSVAVSPLMQAIAVYVRTHYSAQSGVPPRTLAFVEKRWRKLPGTGCVYQRIATSAGGRTLSIRDVRAVDSTLQLSLWEDGAEEPGICLVDNWLRLERRRISGDAGISCALSLHSIGRFFQRQLGGSGTIEALTRELGHLAEVAPPLLAGREPDLHIETPSGAWHGHVARDMDGKRSPWVNLRTFF